MRTTVYKMHGMAEDFLAAVDADGGRIYVLADKNGNPPIRDLTREDVKDCSSWDVYDLREWADPAPASHEYATFDDMFYDVVFQNGTADIMKKWDDMDI